MFLFILAVLTMPTHAIAEPQFPPWPWQIEPDDGLVFYMTPREKVSLCTAMA
jgi:hypothetical protein